MDINLTFAALGHGVRLHLCLEGGKLSDNEDEAELVELSSNTQRLGFQPNEDDEDMEDEDDDELSDKSQRRGRAPSRRSTAHTWFRRFLHAFRTAGRASVGRDLQRA